MSFYKSFLFSMTFTILLHGSSSRGNKELVIQKRGLETLMPCGVGLVFFADVNNTSSEDLEVSVVPDECCMEVGADEDCDLIEIVGDCVETVPKGSTKTLKFVAPLVDPFERNGYCIIYVDSKPKNKRRGTMRNKVRIPFDTHLKNTKQLMDIPDNVTSCPRIDQDRFNNCKPVDCETYYNGKKSFFDRKTKRCRRVPRCVSESTDEDIPDVIYDFTKNKCIEGESISDKDIDFIKELAGGNERKPKEILIIEKLKPSSTANPLYDMKNVSKEVSRLTHNDYSLERAHAQAVQQINKVKEKSLKFFMSKYFIANRGTIIFFGCIILVQCCLIVTVIYCLGRECTGYKKKTLIRKFFNYRQDASVTTPLICTSNIDTETTEFQYLSESSNVDKKIKCYKACQKERNNNVKMSMSDDILSKCLTRRDWNSKPAKSEAIPEMALADDNRRVTIETINESAYQTNASSQSRKPSHVKVNFKKEERRCKKEKNESVARTIVKKMKRNRDYDDDVIPNELSEKEIKCHSYNNVETHSNVTGFKNGSHTKKLGYFKTDKSKKGTSISTEKEAQAAFSNDSIDDFLSERGLIFLAGENLSKYSFSSQSNGAKSSSLSSEVSSKTSKNNVVKNVLSMLHRRSKHGPSSDPGAKKSSELDLELIHLSRASVYSSNNESDYLKSLKITKDSRSSL